MVKFVLKDMVEHSYVMLDTKYGSVGITTRPEHATVFTLVLNNGVLGFHPPVPLPFLLDEDHAWRPMPPPQPPKA